MFWPTISSAQRFARVIDSFYEIVGTGIDYCCGRDIGSDSTMVEM